MRSRLHSLRAITLLTSICFLVASCGSTRHVAPASYAQLEPSDNQHLDVQTVEGRYQVSKFSFTDSTLVIAVALRPSYPDNPANYQVPPRLPHAVPLYAIDSISEVKYGWTPTQVIVGVGIVGAVVGLFVYLLGNWLDHVIDFQ